MAEHKDFAVWWLRFQAFAFVMKFDGILSSGATKHSSLPSSYADGEQLNPSTKDADEKKQYNMWRQNTIGMAYFTLAFKSARLLRLIRGAKTAEYPGGRVDLVLKGLFGLYSPKDMTSKVELTQRKTEIKMKENEHPKTLFDQMNELESEFGVDFKLEDQIPILIAASPKMYHAIIVTEQRAKGDKLTITDLEDAMTTLYRTVIGSRKADGKMGDEDHVELAMGAVVCHYCKKAGHIKKDCFKLKKPFKQYFV